MTTKIHDLPNSTIEVLPLSMESLGIAWDRSKTIQEAIASKYQWVVMFSSFDSRCKDLPDYPQDDIYLVTDKESGDCYVFHSNVRAKALKEFLCPNSDASDFLVLLGTEFIYDLTIFGNSSSFIRSFEALAGIGLNAVTAGGVRFSDPTMTDSDTSKLVENDKVPIVSMDGISSMADYLSSLSKNRRRNVKRYALNPDEYYLEVVGYSKGLANPLVGFISNSAVNDWVSNTLLDNFSSGDPENGFPISSEGAYTQWLYAKAVVSSEPSTSFAVIVRDLTKGTICGISIFVRRGEDVSFAFIAATKSVPHIGSNMLVKAVEYLISTGFNKTMFLGIDDFDTTSDESKYMEYKFSVANSYSKPQFHISVLDSEGFDEDSDVYPPYLDVSSKSWIT